MGRMAYFDCFAGISGDMTLGALIDAGADLDALRATLTTIPDVQWELTAESVARGAIAATDVRIALPAAHANEPGHEHAPHRSYADICGLLERSGLSQAVRAQALKVFDAIAVAEGKVHGIAKERVHFHELGGVDSIIDIVGAVAALDQLGVDEVHASPLPWFRGRVECAHGVLPLPAPAVVELLRDIPVYPTEVEGELITPTGAGLLRALSRGFGPPPAHTVSAVGYGAGKSDVVEPNVLRVIIGETECWPESRQVLLIECNIDDMNPEFYELALERLLDAGAVDAFLTPIQMKKNRPAVTLSAICPPAAEAAVTAAMLRHTTTLGVRRSRWQRHCLARRSAVVETPFGPIRVKLAQVEGVTRCAPEYDDCAAAARQHSVPLAVVYQAANDAARSLDTT